MSCYVITSSTKNGVGAVKVTFANWKKKIIQEITRRYQGADSKSDLRSTMRKLLKDLSSGKLNELLATAYEEMHDIDENIDDIIEFVMD